MVDAAQSRRRESSGFGEAMLKTKPVTMTHGKAMQLSTNKKQPSLLLGDQSGAASSVAFNWLTYEFHRLGVDHNS
jgi:hypothetical protein